METILFLMQYSIIPVGIVFVLLMALTYLPGRRARFEHDANIPLRDDR